MDFIFNLLQLPWNPELHLTLLAIFQCLSCEPRNLVRLTHCKICSIVQSLLPTDDSVASVQQATVCAQILFNCTCVSPARPQLVSDGAVSLLVAIMKKAMSTNHPTAFHCVMLCVQAISSICHGKVNTRRVVGEGAGEALLFVVNCLSLDRNHHVQHFADQSSATLGPLQRSRCVRAREGRR
jgi:hypothetical protein